MKYKGNVRLVDKLKKSYHPDITEIIYMDMSLRFLE
jgi:hypothetical protein